MFLLYRKRIRRKWLKVKRRNDDTFITSSMSSNDDTFIIVRSGILIVVSVVWILSEIGSHNSFTLHAQPLIKPDIYMRLSMKLLTSRDFLLLL